MGRRIGPAGRVIVVDDVGVAHSFDPGDEVPAWAAKLISNPKAWADNSEPATPAPAAPGGPANGGADGDGDTDSGADGSTKPYAQWKKPDLVAEVERRNTGRDADDLIEVEGKGTVADLAAALDGDDAAQAG